MEYVSGEIYAKHSMGFILKVSIKIACYCNDKGRPSLIFCFADNFKFIENLVEEDELRNTFKRLD